MLKETARKSTIQGYTFYRLLICYLFETPLPLQPPAFCHNPMASSPLCLLFLPLLLSSILLLNHPVKCDDEEDNLFQGINSYRASLNLTVLSTNDNAECLAEEIADQFNNQPCTNTTGSNTVPGTEPQFSDYPVLLAKCHLNVSNTQDGVIMPSCVPNLEPSLVLSNFTKSQYSGNLNDTKYTGAGIGSKNNWIVVVLTTSTSTGSFAPSTSAASLVSRIGLIYHLLFFLMGSILLL